MAYGVWHQSLLPKNHHKLCLRHLCKKRIESVLERAKEQALVGFSMDPNKLLSFSISLLLNSPIAEFSSVLGCFAMCA